MLHEYCAIFQKTVKFNIYLYPKNKKGCGLR